MNELQKIEPEAQQEQSASLIQVENSRAMQEIQAAVISAKKFPRDTIAAHKRIMDACKRKVLAEQSMYAFPRGGQTVTGPSIKLAEVLAQNWGNIRCGVTELERTAKESTLMAYCVDLETNYQKTVAFVVPNERHTKKGIMRLTDPRDIYENNMNNGSRRLRNCILAVIPGDIVEEAVNECEKTLKGDNSEPHQEKIKRVLKNMELIGIDQAMIEKRFGKKLEALLAVDVVQLNKIGKSIQDGVSKKEDWFSSGDSGKSKDLTEKFKTKSEEEKKEDDKPKDGDLPPFDEFEDQC